MPHTTYRIPDADDDDRSYSIILVIAIRVDVKNSADYNQPPGVAQTHTHVCAILTNSLVARGGGRGPCKTSPPQDDTAVWNRVRGQPQPQH